MKRLKPLLTKTGIVGAFVLFTFGLGTMEGAAQQMADMPYDLHYIDMTIIHHQDGIEMAQIAQTRAVNTKIKAFAAKTAADQQKDIEELQPHRNHLYAESRGGLGTALLEKRGDDWGIVHWHSSAPRRAPAPTATPKT